MYSDLQNDSLGQSIQNIAFFKAKEKLDIIIFLPLVLESLDKGRNNDTLYTFLM